MMNVQKRKIIDNSIEGTSEVAMTVTLLALVCCRAKQLKSIQMISFWYIISNELEFMNHWGYFNL